MGLNLKFLLYVYSILDFPVTRMVKRLPTMQETWVRPLGWEDPPEKAVATHSSTLAWKNPMDGGACWATAHGVTKSRTLTDFTSTSTQCITYQC